MKTKINEIIDRLEKLSVEKDLKFLFAQEKSPTGSLVLSFKVKERTQGYSIRVSHDELIASPVEAIVEHVRSELNEWL